MFIAINISCGNHVFEDNGGFADPELFDIFTFGSLVNDPKSALTDRKLLLSVHDTKIYSRFFENGNPMENNNA